MYFIEEHGGEIGVPFPGTGEKLGETALAPRCEVIQEGERHGGALECESAELE